MIAKLLDFPPMAYRCRRHRTLFVGAALCFISACSVRTMFLRGTATNRDVTTWHNPNPTSLSYKERRDRLLSYTSLLPICRLVPKQCGKQNVLLSAGWMHANIMGMGANWVCVLALVCGVLGIRWSVGGLGDSERAGSDEACIEKRNADMKEEVEMLPLVDPLTDATARLNDDNITTFTVHNHAPSSHFRRCFHKIRSWWVDDSSLCFTHPIITMKLFILVLIWLELQCIVSPSQSILATPELVWLMAEAPKRKDLVPPMAEWLLRWLNENTVSGMAHKLGVIRAVGLTFWFLFLLLPAARRGRSSYAVVVGICYAIGAISYIYLGTIGLMYKLSHSTQGGMLFVAVAAFAIPSLDSSNDRASAAASSWLRKFLYVGILIPIYLMSGICKIRYMGFAANLNGKWMWELFEPDSRKFAAWESMRTFIYNRKSMLAIMSWGNLVLELVLPFALILRLESVMLRNVFHCTALAFHISIFFLVGPNFSRYCLLHLLACDPTGWVASAGREYQDRHNNGRQASAAARIGDWLRMSIGMIILIEWFHVQILSDADHLLGRLDRLKKRDPYFPISEFSMFAAAKDPDYILSSVLVVAAIVAYWYSVQSFSTYKRKKYA